MSMGPFSFQSSLEMGAALLTLQVRALAIIEGNLDHTILTTVVDKSGPIAGKFVSTPWLRK
jgi:hypothetical protein